jgi:hypothetical protein
MLVDWAGLLSRALEFGRWEIEEELRVRVRVRCVAVRYQKEPVGVRADTASASR